MTGTDRVTTIDCGYLAPRVAASYLLVEGGEAAFVDANTARAVPRMLEALAGAGLRPEAVRYVAVTHAHLDHAHGAATLLSACPNAVLVAHPRAARHLEDPAKLERSVRQVYGDAFFDETYGPMRPIPPERIRVVSDGEEIPFGEGSLRSLHTPGHAKHHACFHWPAAGAVFSGDSFGMAYPDLQGGGLFIFPSTSPTDFDPAPALDAVARIAGLGAGRVYLAHFGALEDVAAAAAQLREHLEFYRGLLETARGIAPDLRKDRCSAEIRGRFERLARERGLTLGPEAWDLLKLDLDLNAAGVAWAAGSAERAARSQR
ncbi:MAG: MBL fold metallo-hydrolase [Elusimicrobia bacterium]|nr:MBL fold metallo-hydrolase [Elusimicrobiota bacterium]